MTLHYHGTPLSPRSELLKMAGKHFCVSFAEPRDADWCLTHGQSVMWDNGAYSIFTKSGKPMDVEAYYKWLDSRLGHPHWAVVPDVIDGDVEQQLALLRTWPFNKSLGAPVWHLGLPIEHLLLLVDGWPKVCFGSSGLYWQVGSDNWCRRVDEAFNAIGPETEKWPDGIKESYEDATKLGESRPINDFHESEDSPDFQDHSGDANEMVPKPDLSETESVGADIDARTKANIATFSEAFPGVDKDTAEWFVRLVHRAPSQQGDDDVEGELRCLIDHTGNIDDCKTMAGALRLIETLKAERDCAMGNTNAALKDFNDMRSERDSLSKRVERLEGVIKPFLEMRFVRRRDVEAQNAAVAALAEDGV